VGAEPALEEPDDPRFVLDEQNAHDGEYREASG
jgi:hypothetical protein